MNTKRIHEIKQHGKTARGKKELIKYLAGGKLTPKQAIQAKCFDCTGYFADGRNDCRMTKCSLYPFMAFNSDKSKRTSRTMSEDHKAKLRAARGQNMPSFALE
jgi:hypothetical protein